MMIRYVQFFWDKMMIMMLKLSRTRAKRLFNLNLVRAILVERTLFHFCVNY